MKKLILTIFISSIIFSVSGCNENQHSKKSDILSRDSQSFINSIICEIQNFVAFIDSVPRSRELQNVIGVKFSQIEKDTFFTLETSYFYAPNFDYYYFRNGYMIVFYNTSILTDKSWLKSLPKEPILEKYKSEKDVIFRPFEAQIKRFQIINLDSVKMISYTQ